MLKYCVLQGRSLGIHVGKRARRQENPPSLVSGHFFLVSDTTNAEHGQNGAVIDRSSRGRVCCTSDRIADMAIGEHYLISKPSEHRANRVAGTKKETYLRVAVCELIHQ
jgi:hypothetical protein